MCKGCLLAAGIWGGCAILSAALGVYWLTPVALIVFVVMYVNAGNKEGFGHS